MPRDRRGRPLKLRTTATEPFTSQSEIRAHTWGWQTEHGLKFAFRYKGLTADPLPKKDPDVGWGGGEADGKEAEPEQKKGK